MDISRTDVEQVITEVWAPSLEIDLAPVPAATAPVAHSTVLVATGGWQGMVVVEASASFARAVAARMFGIPRGEVGPDDEADAVGELANVVAGNCKSLLTEDEVDLGLPVLGQRWDGSGQLLTSAVLAAGPGFEVAVHVVEGAPAPVA